MLQNYYGTSMVLINHCCHFSENILIGEKNQFFVPGNYLRSSNSCFKLSLNHDGNLALNNEITGETMWSSQTNGSVTNFDFFVNFGTHLLPFSIQR